MIYIDIDGPPIAWKRPGHRSIRQKDKNIAIIYDRQKREKEMVRWQMRSQFKDPILTTPLLVDIVFRMTIPKQTSGKLRTQMLNGVVFHFKRPDCDNLAGFYLDCMNELVYKDDAQICDLHVRKIYSLVPSTLIRIRPYTMNITKEEIDSIEELDDYEDNFREDGRGKLPRNSSEQARIIPIRGEDPPLEPV
ncbi:MAG: RusA family crossover junction endodeoxyribonuclease [Candidatus Micrarchaeaceae archaeon]|jgi:Holliday junction resolvase RusA-like endonuclease